MEIVLFRALKLAAMNNNKQILVHDMRKKG